MTSTSTNFYEALSPKSQPEFLDLEAGLLREMQTISSKARGGHESPCKIDADASVLPSEYMHTFGSEEENFFHSFVWPPATVQPAVQDQQLVLKDSPRLDKSLPSSEELMKYVRLLEERIDHLQRQVRASPRVQGFSIDTL
jgi:hypothetical protein